MNTVDLLLALDAKKLKKPTKDIEIERLSVLTGGKAIFKCQSIDAERYTEIQQDSVDISKKGKLNKIHMSDMRVFTILDGVTEPSLKDKALCEHFGAVTPKELVNKLLLPGEIDQLFNTIQELSGFTEEKDEETNEEIKN